MMLSVAILAGGLATRLRPLTETLPKALIRVNHIPFIDYQLHDLKQQGIGHVVLCLGYLGEMVETHVGDGSRYGLAVEYSYDGEYYLGTCGAIKKALPLLGEHFFILYGDSFLPIDFKEVQKKYESHQSLALMTILKNHNQWDRSNVLLKASGFIEYDKITPKSGMDFIDYGLIVVAKKIFNAVLEGEKMDLSSLFNQLSLKNEMIGLEVFERFYEIGSFHGLRETEDYFINKRN